MRASEGAEMDHLSRRGLSPRHGGAMYRVRRAIRILGLQASSSLVRRIIVLNLVGLVALLGGFLYLNQFREGLIDARVQSLLIQGEIIAGAIAGSATVETDSITIDPERLLQMQAGESIVVGDDEVEFSINPARVAPLLRRLVTPTRTRARIYDQDAELLLDSASLYSRGDILKFDLAPPDTTDKTIFERTWNLMKHGFGSMAPKPVEEAGGSSGRTIPEVARALGGLPASTVRVNSLGDTIVSVAVPIQRSRLVKGVLLLSTLWGDIDTTIDKERMASAGASFGGYMMNWFQGNTTRFKTLITHCGVYNFDSMYATTEELWFDEWEHGGPPWGPNRNSYEKHSPHRLAANFKTPMLIIHNDLDFRVPVSEGHQLFTTLQRLGVPSKFIKCPDEGHWVVKPRNSEYWHKEVFAWLARYAPPGAR